MRVKWGCNIEHVIKWYESALFVWHNLQIVWTYYYFYNCAEQNQKKSIQNESEVQIEPLEHWSEVASRFYAHHSEKFDFTQEYDTTSSCLYLFDVYAFEAFPSP